MHKKFYSQAGQDAWVVRDVFNFRSGGYFIEIGAFDGVNLSNTFYLEKHLKWNGICIEADSQSFHKLQKNRRCECLNICVGDGVDKIEFISQRGPYSGSKQTRQTTDSNADDGAPVENITTTPLSKVFQQHNIPETIDYLSLDVEGMEYDVMKTFPFDTYHFLSATIERPDSRLREMLSENGYLLVIDQPGMDAFYLHPRLAASYTNKILKRSSYASSGLISRLFENIQSIFQDGIRNYLKRL